MALGADQPSLGCWFQEGHLTPGPSTPSPVATAWGQASQVPTRITAPAPCSCPCLQCLPESSLPSPADRQPCRPGCIAAAVLCICVRILIVPRIKSRVLCMAQKQVLSSSLLPVPEPHKSTCCSQCVRQDSGCKRQKPNSNRRPEAQGCHLHRNCALFCVFTVHGSPHSSGVLFSPLQLQEVVGTPRG